MGHGCSRGQHPDVVETIVDIHTPRRSLHHSHPSTTNVNIVELGEDERRDGMLLFLTPFTHTTQDGPRMYKDFLSTTEFKVFTVREVKQLTHNTKQLRFWLPNGTMLDIPVGTHIQMR